MLQIGYSKFLFSRKANKKGQFWLYTVHPLYGDALGVRVPVFRILLSYQRENKAL